VVAAPYLSDAVESLVQCHGLGALRPNTGLLKMFLQVFLGYPELFANSR
jgi:hypothetical protein